MVEHDTNLPDAIARAKSSSAPERVQALADIKQIFRHNEHNHRIDNLSDKAWHSLFEALFECTRAERAGFLKTNKGNKLSSEKRLENCGSTLRLVVEVGVHRLRNKTVKALLDHIMQALPTSDGYCGPILVNYLKALRTLLEYPPHVEHLREYKKDSAHEFQEWSEIVKFCAEGVTFFASEGDSDAATTQLSTSRSLLRTLTTSAESSAKSTLGESSARKPRSGNSSVPLGEFIACLRYLTRATNAPIFKAARLILDVLFQFLHSATSVSRAHHDALCAINSVLLRIAPQSIELTQYAVRQIVPLIKDMWLSKSATFRDEMLIALVTTKEHVLHMLYPPNAATSDFQTDIEALLEVFTLDHCRRLERDLLSLDDLRLEWRSEQSARVTTPHSHVAFRLQNGNIKGEANWTLVELMALFASALDTERTKSVEEKEPRSTKRTRKATYFDEFLKQATHSTGSARLGAIQWLAFMAQFTAFDAASLDKMLDRLGVLISHDKGEISSWAMLAIASCAFQKVSVDATLQAAWEKVAQLSLKFVSSPSCCRAACHLCDAIFQLKLAPTPVLKDAVDNILSSVDLVGPAVVSDTSMALWSTLLYLKESENPSMAPFVSERALHWLFTKFTPSKFDEKTYTLQPGLHFGVPDILRLIGRCTNQQLCCNLRTYFHRHGPVGQAWQRASDSKTLVDYILLLENDYTFIRTVPDRGSLPDHHTSQAPPSPTASRSTIEFCYRETTTVMEKWEHIVAERAKSVTPIGIRLVACLCMISDKVVAHANGRTAIDAERLRAQTTVLAKSVAAFLALKECDQAKIDALYDSVADCLPDLALWNATCVPDTTDPQGLSFLIQLSNGLQSRLKSQEKNRFGEMADLMDLDTAFDSQASNGQSKPENKDGSREDASLTDATSFQSCILRYLVLLSSQVDAVAIPDYVPSSFIDHLTNLAPEDFCIIKPLLTLLWSSPLIMSSSSTDSMVEYVADNFLEDYRFDRHEIALNICIDLLAHHASQWTDSEANSINEAAGQIYHWFVTVALPNNLCSLSVRQRLADLFFDLLEVKGPGYTGPEDDDQSIRTYIFTLFKSRELRLTHKIARNIPNFFNCFVLGEHEAVFNDLYKNLTDKTDWTEGLAMRLLVLAELGSRWQTLRRRCIYHIFETAGMVESSSDHARHCISKIAAAVQLPNSRNLFRLFASQLLFTWLGVQTISTIPFAIFDYTSLDALIRDVQDEAFPQAIMRAKETDIGFLTKTLKSPGDEILKSTFAKSAAYCFAWDVDKGSADGQIASSEARVIGLLGRKKYHELLPTHMPYILGVFFTTIEQEEQVGKLLTRRSSTQPASAVLTEILAISASNYTLPFDQQPTFLARNLIDRIGRLWRQLGHNDISKIWTPPVYVFVLRMLLSKIHPALGSLHACSMIRKLRILVALAGSVALRGYALEMALHALLPFTTDKQCADDALGIVQYLLQQGTQSLASSIHSVAGLVVSAFVSLRKFVGSSQDSTTQESQHVATMEKAQRFHTWLSTQWLPAYAEAVQLQGYDERLLKRFSATMHAASEARAEANAIDGTTESKLLLDLLQDQSGGAHLLKGSILDLIFRSFCSQFKPPPSFRSDILGQDSHAEDLAGSVWHSSRVHGVDEQYRMWAARVIGRAYNASGSTSLRHTPHCGRILPGEDDVNESDDPAWTSKSIIFEVLEDMLRSSNSREVGLVEDSIRWMLSRMGGDLRGIQGLLTSSVISALTLSTTDPIEPTPPFRPVSLEDAFGSQNQPSVDAWLQAICIALANKAFADPIVASLTRAIHGIPAIAERLFPPILHIVLLREYEGKQETRKIVSWTLKSLFHDIDPVTVPRAKAALEAIMYLRKQPLPKETTPADRERWLELDYVEAARAADYCQLHTTALLLAELGCTQNQPQRSSRRSSVLLPPTVPDDLLLSIYTSIEEPDSFYGVNQEASLSSVLNRLDYEAKGFKSLLFRSAQADSEMRRLRNISGVTAGGLVSALNFLNLNSLNHALLSSEQFKAAGPNTAERALEAARKLEQWDMRVPEPASAATTIVYAVLQGISNATNMGEVRRQLNRGFTDALAMMVAKDTSPELIRSGSRTLGTLTEIDDIMTSLSLENLEDAYANMKQRERWMLSAQAKYVRPVISTRQTLFSLLSSNPNLQSILRLKASDARRLEVKNLIASCGISRQLQASQELLASATYLADIVPVCLDVGLDVADDAQQTLAEVLWDQGEHSTSIRMLQQLAARSSTIDNAAHYPRAVVLARLGHNVAEARLEQPEDIINNYLRPAVEELRGQHSFEFAGEVLHEFASFCDKQLSNNEDATELIRLKQSREQREVEVRDLDEMFKAVKSGRSDSRNKLKVELNKARRWLEIETNEYNRLKAARESYLTQSLENYLLSLSSSADHDTDVLRFFSIWLEFADEDLANKAVEKYIERVPSAKFVVLINQLTSRLQAENTDFQHLLSRLIFRVCADHPHHAMHNVFSAIKSSSGAKDDASKARVNAAMNVAKALQADKRSSMLWKAIYQTDNIYHGLAMLKDQEIANSPGREYPIDKFAASKAIKKVVDYKLPPPTASIPLRGDLDYSKVPRVTGFHAKMRVANGLSTPKIVTGFRTDGKMYKELFKGGHDDLRQDAIMEQVFEQASKLLKNHTATRQRNLHIRTYKVLPLSSTSGLMEFVQNTIALHDFVMPAHQKYYPKDMNPRSVRNVINECANQPTEVRIREFKEVISKFHPVGRFFFLERFVDPDEWFEKRLAYTRTTAAISVLGWVLGLGDRHCHNILLDEKTGEVVHIDLGVAFEAGRILPIPEVVPFRLTRDLVDAMGINRTEGVLRRCCEFTLEALREERESIMTLLNVLRYDPLYNWTVSPLRAKRMQESEFGESRRQGGPTEEAGGEHKAAESKKKVGGVGGVGEVDEVDEAERALSVVEKKLSKSLSTAATVSELIQQATDERNLAVLYSGWAAYA